jgi:hypothetical protein
MKENYLEQSPVYNPIQQERPKEQPPVDDGAYQTAPNFDLYDDGRNSLMMQIPGRRIGKYTEGPGALCSPMTPEEVAAKKQDNGASMMSAVVIHRTITIENPIQ